MPHTAVLPLNYTHLKAKREIRILILNSWNYCSTIKLHWLNNYVGATRTPISKYQKFMTYRLVYNISLFKVNPTWTDKIFNQIVLSYSCLPIPSLPLCTFVYRIHRYYITNMSNKLLCRRQDLYGWSSCNRRIHYTH